ncbi:uncharacterized protein LOC126674964 isoform X2 [Mercurialis annua]|uniref:uncharacterized protein LOC126674964 isoform X2 n=1 Tax=Mercurialis annua TaxID=3986 RepID=UPI00215FDD33|nr:uncharacterized protein LOC126674964 isoform X2 [Mercurialis annua]
MHKLKSLMDAVSPINTQFDNNENSALVKYFCTSGLPIISINNVAAFTSPEMTAKSSSGSNRFERRSPLSSLPSDQNVMMKSPTPSRKAMDRTPTTKVVDDVPDNSSASSEGRNQFSSGDADPTSFKSELCSSLENSGHCCDGFKSQETESDRQEEIRPACSNHSESPPARSDAQGVAPKPSTLPLASRDEGTLMSSTLKVSENTALDIISQDVKTGQKQRFVTNSQSSKKRLTSTLNDHNAHSQKVPRGSFKSSPSSRSYAQTVAPGSSTPPLAPRDEGTQISSTLNVSDYPVLDTIRRERNVITGNYRQRFDPNKRLTSTLNDPTVATQTNLSDGTKIPETEVSEKSSIIDTIPYKPWSPSECSPGDESKLFYEETDALAQKTLYGPRTRRRPPMVQEE